MYNGRWKPIEGVFSEDGGIAEIDPSECLEDLMLYKEEAFEFEETTEVFSLIVSFFEKNNKARRKCE